MDIGNIKSSLWSLKILKEWGIKVVPCWCITLSGYQNGQFFGKVPNGLPNFRKIILRIFSGIHDQITVYNGKNLQYNFLDWKCHPSLRDGKA